MADIKKFLNKDGVSTLWSRVAEELNKKATAEALEGVKTTADDALAKATANAASIETNATGIADNKAAIAILNSDSSVEGSVAYKIAQIVVANDGAIDTLEEIAAWIATHPEDVAQMNANIEANASAIEALEGLVGDKAVATQIADAIAAENLDQYALASDLTALATRVTTVEGKVTTLEGTVGGHTTDITNLTSRIDGIVAGGGEPNTINTIKVNGVAQTITDKAVDITVPEVDALTTEEIDAAIAAAATQVA